MSTRVLFSGRYYLLLPIFLLFAASATAATLSVYEQRSLYKSALDALTARARHVLEGGSLLASGGAFRSQCRVLLLAHDVESLLLARDLLALLTTMSRKYSQ